MTNATFNPDDLREYTELEVKRAGGKDGKGALPNSVWETYSAFANTDGGTILLGVEEKKGGNWDVTGIEATEKVLGDFWSQVNSPEKVSFNLLTNDSVKLYPAGNERWVIAIEVPRASRKQRPVYINNNPMSGTFKRLHANDHRCQPEEVRRMLAEQTEDARDARMLANFGFADLDNDSFRAYRQRLASIEPDHPFNNSDNTEFLRQIGGWLRSRETGEEGLTLAGLLMFGKHGAILEAVPHYFLDYRELPFAGAKTEWIDRLTPDGTWSGNLFDFYQMAIRRLTRDVKVPFKLEGDQREDDTPVHKALREALVNTLIHADYSVTTPIRIIKAPDIFEFQNPGRMRIPVEKALEGGHTDGRNRSLQRMFSLINLGEQAGSGIPRVLENWRSQHYRAPELLETQEPEATLMRLRTVSLLPEETLDALHAQFGSAFDRLNENERLALATAHIENFVTNVRLQQICPLHRHDITSVLRKLVDEGFLESDGHGRATSYRIAGTPAIDLAETTDFSGANSTHLDPSSVHLDPSSVHLDPSSVHLDPSSVHLDPSSVHLEHANPTSDPNLLRIAEPVRSTGKTNTETVRKTILDLCEKQFLTIAQLGVLLGRSPDNLRIRYVKPMTDEGLLIRRFPQQPNHEQQAYQASND